jgi:hypothetical protein
VSVQVICSILGGLGRRLGLSRVTRRIAQAARTLRPAPAIQVVGPAATGKTTLVQYLGHPPRPDEPVSSVGPPRPGRLAADWSEASRSWFRSKLIDDGLGQQTHEWAGRLKRSNPEGVIVVVDTHHPDDDHAYVQTLYHSYRDVSAHATRVKSRVLLILLNKFDRWGNTTAAREAMMQRSRTAVFPEVVNRFRVISG